MTTGFLFDLDGTLINSEDAILRCWTILANEMGVPVSEFTGKHGIPASQTIQMVFPEMPHDEVIKWRDRLEYLEINDTSGVKMVAGARELIDYLNENKIPWSIVTSGTPDLAATRVEATGVHFPETSVTFGDVEKGKPHPDPYLLGAKRLGLDPSQCWAVEDAPAGVKSAKSAGCKVAAVLTTHSAEELQEADVLLTNIYDVLKVSGIL